MTITISLLWKRMAMMITTSLAVGTRANAIRIVTTGCSGFACCWCAYRHGYLSVAVLVNIRLS